MNQSAAFDRLRDVLRRQHKAFSTESSYPTNLIVRLLYGCGLRVTEPLNLRIKDVNLEDFRLYRMHEAHVQRAVKEARRKLGILVLPHELRHGCATHCMERGVSPRAIQQVMGHASLETTMGYLHAESLSVPSPLDALATGMFPPKPGASIGGAGSIQVDSAPASPPGERSFPRPRLE